MRRIGILVWISCVVFVSIAWAQAPSFPRIGRHQPAFTNRSKPFSTTHASFNQQVLPGRQNVVYDLGNYPGGTWSEPRGINNHGLVVSFGDIPSGFTRPVTASISGPTIGQWSDLGTLGGDRTD